ncbi:methyltransferase domain-containing protein [Streptomyces sp. NPDC006274]|uniref:methyltransferase domain-containing protein n=1 Tax=unclassified Streptomyces TaxID=2593676 RepID=UPI0033A26F64
MSAGAESYLSTALDIMEKRSLVRRTVDWEQVRSEAFSRADGAQKPADTYGAITSAVNSLHDGHSSFFAPEQAKRLEAPVTTFDDLRGRSLEGRFGYVSLPGVQGSEQSYEEYVQRGRRAVVEADRSQACGWVVDLRRNRGGNMWPMLAVVAPILGDGKVGAFVDADGGRTMWTIEDGSPRYDGESVGWPGGEAVTAGDPPVAVLTSGATGSAGEAVAVAFAGGRTRGSSARAPAVSLRETSPTACRTEPSCISPRSRTRTARAARMTDPFRRTRWSSPPGAPWEAARTGFWPRRRPGWPSSRCASDPGPVTVPVLPPVGPSGPAVPCLTFPARSRDLFRGSLPARCGRVASMPFDHNDRYHRLLLRQVPRDAVTGLDVGCGAGRFARRVAALGLDVDAVDPSAEVIAEARALSAGARSPRFTQADVTGMELPKGHYDFVSCLASLHHMPFGTVAALRDALAPGGVLVVLGCYAERTPLDRAWSLAAVPVNAVARLGVAVADRFRGMTADGVVRAPVRQPETGLAEIRREAAVLLPGSRVRRLLFWRCLIVFHNGG